MIPTTIVIASYRYGHLVSHAIESVLSQTYEPEKIIVIDDGVGDLPDLKRLYGHVDNLEVVEREKNCGVVANFQDALMHMVETPYVMFLGADNWLRDDALEQISYYTDCDIVHYPLLITGELAHEFVFKNGLIVQAHDNQPTWRTPHPHGSSWYNVELARKVGGYERNPNSKHTEEDMMLFNKMIEAGAKVGFVDEPLLYYRRHRENFNKI